MRTHLYVVSDLHIGGQKQVDGTDFQMCRGPNRERLAQFCRWIRDDGKAAYDRHLVLAGDIVDFLAEKDASESFVAFEPDDRRASEKLLRILNASSEVWNALREFVESGGALTMMLGNHDIEL